MDAAMSMDADPWLEKKPDGLEHQYSLRPADQLAQSVDDIGLQLVPVDDSDPSGDVVNPGDTADPGEAPPFKVTMYQCAQCKTTFTTLDLCVNHQCSMDEHSAPGSNTRTQQQQQASGSGQAQRQAGSGQAQQAEVHVQVEAQAAHETDLNTSDDGQGTNYRWGQHDTVALLETLTSSVDKFNNPNLKRKFIWKIICDKVVQKGFNVTHMQCENKWKTLKAMWRKAQISNTSPAFYREMCEIAAQYPQLMAESTLSADYERPERPAPGSAPKNCWTREASLTMLAFLKARHEDYSNPNIKRRSLWAEISEAMRDIHMNYTPEQCESRLKTLLMAYRRAQNRWDQTGEGAESDCFYQVDELIHLIPELAGSAAGRAGGAGTASPRRAAPVSARRRRVVRGARQRSLVTWLETWLHEQRRWDEGVQAVLRAQHTERLRVLTEIRDQLRDGGSRVPVTMPPPPLPPLPNNRLPGGHEDDTVVTQVFLA